MKLLIVALALVAVVAASPVGEIFDAESPYKFIRILRSDFDQQPEGGYSFNFETENGITRTETGVVKEALDEDNKPHLVVVVRGSYSYINAEGKPETVNYIADEDGFHPEGDSIPKLFPPVPQ